MMTGHCHDLKASSQLLKYTFPSCVDTLPWSAVQPKLTKLISGDDITFCYQSWPKSHVWFSTLFHNNDDDDSEVFAVWKLAKCAQMVFALLLDSQGVWVCEGERRLFNQPTKHLKCNWIKQTLQRNFKASSLWILAVCCNWRIVWPFPPSFVRENKQGRLDIKLSGR